MTPDIPQLVKWNAAREQAQRALNAATISDPSPLMDALRAIRTMGEISHKKEEAPVTGMAIAAMAVVAVLLLVAFAGLGGGL